MHIPLLKLGGAENFADYQRAWDELFPGAVCTDVLGNEVHFASDRCEHVCFKTADSKWNRGPRSEWSQERAERISWIPVALRSPNFICLKDSQAWAYLLEVDRDPQTGEGAGLFSVIIDPARAKPKQPGVVHFLTAYAITGEQWGNLKRNRPWIYPEDTAPPKKRKRRK